MTFRRWLLKLVLGKDFYVVKRAAWLSLDEWYVCVQDPAMQRHEEDLEVVEAVKRDIAALGKWF